MANDNTVIRGERNNKNSCAKTSTAKEYCSYKVVRKEDKRRWCHEGKQLHYWTELLLSCA